ALAQGEAPDLRRGHVDVVLGGAVARTTEEAVALGKDVEHAHTGHRLALVASVGNRFAFVGDVALTSAATATTATATAAGLGLLVGQGVDTREVDGRLVGRGGIGFGLRLTPGVGITVVTVCRRSRARHRAAAARRARRPAVLGLLVGVSRGRRRALVGGGLGRTRPSGAAAAGRRARGTVAVGSNVVGVGDVSGLAHCCLASCSVGDKGTTRSLGGPSGWGWAVSMASRTRRVQATTASSSPPLSR